MPGTENKSMNQRQHITNLQQELEISEQKRLRLLQDKLMQDSDPENGSLWIMLDLMTLILIFFILLYTHQTGIHAKGFPVSLPSVQTIMEKVQKKTGIPDSSRFDEHFVRMRRELVNAMDQINIKDYSIDLRKDRLVLTIGESISFPPGQDRLMDTIKGPLGKIAKLITSQYTYQVIVSGHTDNTPIHTRKFPSNWELSLGRAMQVARFLMANGVDPHGISVEGFGPYRPVADNLDALGRKANRRVEISLLTQAL